MKKIELLSPAGNMDGFLAAMNAGADAVYLSGTKFGARAYAQNLSNEEIIEALYYAHIRGRRVYLTVNTLLKNLEIRELYNYLAPLYEAGLDAVIVQDFGAVELISKCFPNMEIHASTQMTVSSVRGAKFMQQRGIHRVVLARELNLAEIKEINECGISTECFIHGSMCYCYSGQCLFSSLIGGRSGNRGRCAQPCRLPYRFENSKEQKYLLSLKDMCTIQMLPMLLESGMDSFKIEGRMKSPAYTAGVTKIYRKYIDLYQKGAFVSGIVSKEDLDFLSRLYIRTSLQDGYYQKLHGKDMVTLQNPAYCKTDDALSNQLMEQYVNTEFPIDVDGFAALEKDKPMSLKLQTAICGLNKEIIVTGETPQKAINASVTKEEFVKRLNKTGGTGFRFKHLEAAVDREQFIPVKAVNELRRRAFNQLKDEIENDFHRALPTAEGMVDLQESVEKVSSLQTCKNRKIIVFVSDINQLMTLFSLPHKDMEVVIPYEWTLKEEFIKLCNEEEKRFLPIFLSLPQVYRDASYCSIKETLQKISEKEFVKGVYVNQLDTLALMKELKYEGELRGDLHLYAMNQLAVTFLESELDTLTIPVELNKDEIRHQFFTNAELMVYGRIPLMQTANCVALSMDACQKGKDIKSSFATITDRTNAVLPVRLHCDEKICYNTIYNCVPVSLHKHWNEIDKLSLRGVQFRFTDESVLEMENILQFYNKRNDADYSNTKFAYPYTNGHFLRGVQ